MALKGGNRRMIFGVCSFLVMAATLSIAVYSYLRDKHPMDEAISEIKICAVPVEILSV